MDIYGRDINPLYLVELTHCQPVIRYSEEGTLSGNLTRTNKTGEYFFTIFFVGVEPVNVVRGSKKEAEEERSQAYKMLKKYL